MLLRSYARRLSTKKAYDVAIIGGGPVGTEVARLTGLIGLRAVVIDPRGALLAAPTGYVSKVLLQTSLAVQGGMHGSRYAWRYAEEALHQTRQRALQMTNALFLDAAVGVDVIKGRVDFAPEIIKGRAAFAGRAPGGGYELS